MKTLHLFAMSFSQNVFSSIVLIFILSVSLISGQNLIGQYRYITYSRYIIENEFLQNSDYFMIGFETLPSDPSEQLNYTNSVREKISAFDGVQGIAYTQDTIGDYRSTPVNLTIYNNDMQNAFNKQLTEGKWFESADNSSDIPNVVVSGAVFNDISVGSNIEIILNGNEQNPERIQQTVHIIGKVGYPWYSAEYNTISEDVSTTDFLVQSNIIIFDDTEQTYEIMNNHTDISSLSFSYFVLYHNSCTDEQKRAARDYFETTGSYVSYDQILENTNRIIRNELMKKTVTPIFLLIVATILLVSVSTLNTYKKLKDHSIYFLCGCSRKKSFSYLFAEISFVTVLATIINMIYVSIHIKWLISGTIGYSNSIIDYKNVIFSVVYCVATIAVTVILPFIVYKKNTPIEIYRRSHND